MNDIQAEQYEGSVAIVVGKKGKLIVKKKRINYWLVGGNLCRVNLEQIMKHEANQLMLTKSTSIRGYKAQGRE